MSAQAIVILVALAFVVGGVVGHALGFRRGRDAQWCENYFANLERERRRHGRDGKFVAIKRAQPTGGPAS
jgi:hypothetical protein